MIRNKKAYQQQTDCDVDLRRYIKVPLKTKLHNLDQASRFFFRLMPASYKKISEKLRELGY